VQAQEEETAAALEEAKKLAQEVGVLKSITSRIMLSPEEKVRPSSPLTTARGRVSLALGSGSARERQSMVMECRIESASWCGQFLVGALFVVLLCSDVVLFRGRMLRNGGGAGGGCDEALLARPLLGAGSQER